MELAFLLTVVVSTAVGVSLRGTLRPNIGRLLVAMGTACLSGAFAVLGLVSLGWWPFGSIAGGLAAVILLGLAALAFPCGAVLRWGRPGDEP